VLAEIGAADIPQVLVFNKLDAIEPERRPLQLEDTYDLGGVMTQRVFVSAQEGEGLRNLRQLLAARLLSATELPVQEDQNFPENNVTFP
jgi:GTP-binding protein HflX